MVFHRVAVDTIRFKVPDSLMGLETLQNLVSPRHKLFETSSNSDIYNEPEPSILVFGRWCTWPTSSLKSGRCTKTRLGVKSFRVFRVTVEAKKLETP